MERVEGRAPKGEPKSPLVGSFEVRLSLGDTPGSTATAVIGKVSDGPTPPLQSWTVSETAGACKLELPRAPFCDPGCGAKVCTEGNTCLAYPSAHIVGDVTLTGVRLEDGSASTTLVQVAKTYQPKPATSFADPPFADGDVIRVPPAAGTIPPFKSRPTGSPPWR